MTTLALSDGIIKDEILVVALAYKKSMRDGKANLVIESGESQLGYSYSRALANIALQ